MIVIPTMRPAGLAHSNDPYFSYVVDLLHFDGADGTTTITQSCPVGPTDWVKRAGGGTSNISTAQSLFGGASWLQSGISTTNYPYSAGPTNTQHKLGTGDFAIEFAARFDSFTSTPIPLDFRKDSASSLVPTFVVSTAGVPRFMSNEVNRIVSAGSISTATWYRFALCRVGGNTRFYQDGVQIGSTYADSTDYVQGTCRFCIGSFGTNLMKGYVDEYRLTKGYGRYSGTSYTLDTGPFPNS